MLARVTYSKKYRSLFFQARCRYTMNRVVIDVITKETRRRIHISESRVIHMVSRYFPRVWGNQTGRYSSAVS